jgi:hypothetical protein
MVIKKTSILSVQIAMMLFTTAFCQAVTSGTDSLQLLYGVQISTRVDPKRVPLNRTLQFTIQIDWEGDLERIEIGEIEEPILANFEIIGTSSSNRAMGTADGKKAMKEIAYTLQPKNLGMGYIESVGLSYEDKVSGRTHSLRTQRVGVEVLSPVPEENEKSGGWIWILGFGFVVLFAAVFVFRIWKSRKKIDENEPEQIVEELFLAELKEKINLKTKDRREAFTILSRLFRRYLSERHGISALEATTEELLSKLQNELDERLLDRCKNLFHTSDVVKFSGQEATQSELEQAYTTVETILESHLARKREDLAKTMEDKPKKKGTKKLKIE